MQLQQGLHFRHALLPQLSWRVKTRQDAVPEGHLKEEPCAIEFEKRMFVNSHLIPGKMSALKAGLHGTSLRVARRKIHTVFGILIVLGPTLCKLDDHFRGAVRQREQIDMNVLQDRQLLPRTDAGALEAPTSSMETCLPGQSFEHNLPHLPILSWHFSREVMDKGPDAGSGVAISLSEGRYLAPHNFIDEKPAKVPLNPAPIPAQLKHAKDERNRRESHKAYLCQQYDGVSDYALEKAGWQADSSKHPTKEIIMRTFFIQYNMMRVYVKRVKREGIAGSQTKPDQFTATELIQCLSKSTHSPPSIGGGLHNGRVAPSKRKCEDEEENTTPTTPKRYKSMKDIHDNGRRGSICLCGSLQLVEDEARSLARLD